MLTRLSRKPEPAKLILAIDHGDLAARFEAGTLSAYHYATDVLGRARIPYPFLYGVDAEIVLRLVPGLPEAVRSCRDADALSDRVNIYLDHCDLGPDGPPEIVVATRCVFHAEQFALELFDADEFLILEPHSDPDHPGRRYVAWTTELQYGDIDDRRAGPWYGATPMAALCAAVDSLEQLSLGEGASEEPI